MEREKRSSADKGLRSLIGRRARYQGQLYEILEVLQDEPPALVLQNCSHTTIQADQHGEAHRRVPETVTIPLARRRTDAIDFGEMEIELLEGRTEPDTVNG